MRSLFSDNRALNILQFLRKNTVMSITMLAARLDVSDRTIRDCQVKCVNYFRLKPDIFVPWCQSVRQ